MSDKLKRLLQLALDGSCSDGEAINSIKAARKIVQELGGFDKALASIGSAPQRSNGGQKGQGPFVWQFYGNPFNTYGQRSGFGSGPKNNWSNEWGETPEQKVKREADEKCYDEIRRKAQAIREARENQEREASEERERLAKEAEERRQAELKKAMHEGRGFPDAYTRYNNSKLWTPDDADDDMFRDVDMMEEMAEFQEVLRKARDNGRV